jgi:hypothetical protein
MNDRTIFPVNARLIVALFVASVSALWLAPASSAQSLTMTGPTSNLTVNPGDTIEAGYEVAISKSPHATDTVSMTNAVVRVSVSCPNGSSESITINLGSQSVTVPADGNGWSPGNYQGTKAPSTLCGGHPGKTNGATLMGTYGHSCHKRGDESNDDCHRDHCFRFHVRNHHNGDDEEGDFSDKHCDNDEHECESPEKHEHRDDCKDDHHDNNDNNNNNDNHKHSSLVGPGVPFQKLVRNLKKDAA